MKTLNLGDDIDRIARKVIQKCKYIPENWIEETKDILHCLQMRTVEQTSFGNMSEDNSSIDSVDDILSFIDSCLSSLYSGKEEKVSATRDLLSICKKIDNLNILVQHEPIMSAMSRLIGDDSICSSDLTFNLGRICLAISSVRKHHKLLSKHGIGSLIISVVQLEVKRKNLLMNSDYPGVTGGEISVGTRRNDNILYVYLSILAEFSVDMSTFQKMLKRDITPLLLSCVTTASRECLYVVLLLLKRASMYEEEVMIMKDWEQVNLVETFVKLLMNDDVQISALVTSILYNLSFKRFFREQMLRAKQLNILMLSHSDSKSRGDVWKIIYQFTVDRDLRILISKSTGFKNKADKFC